MATLKNVQVGWKWLEDVLNGLIGAINGNEPLEGSGIRIVDTSNGKLISVAAETTGQNSSGGGSAGGGGGAQAPHSLSTSIQWFGVKWQDVTVVDPSTCAQSTLSVLVNTGSQQDSIMLEPIKPAIWGDPK